MKSRCRYKCSGFFFYRKYNFSVRRKVKRNTNKVPLLGGGRGGFEACDHRSREREFGGSERSSEGQGLLGHSSDESIT